jgi:predicted RNA methylase
MNWDDVADLELPAPVSPLAPPAPSAGIRWEDIASFEAPAPRGSPIHLGPVDTVPLSPSVDPYNIPRPPAAPMPSWPQPQPEPGMMPPAFPGMSGSAAAMDLLGTPAGPRYPELLGSNAMLDVLGTPRAPMVPNVMAGPDDPFAPALARQQQTDQGFERLTDPNWRRLPTGPDLLEAIRQTADEVYTIDEGYGWDKAQRRQRLINRLAARFDNITPQLIEVGEAYLDYRDLQSGRVPIPADGNQRGSLGQLQYAAGRAFQDVQNANEGMPTREVLAQTETRLMQRGVLQPGERAASMLGMEQQSPEEVRALADANQGKWENFSTGMGRTLNAIPAGIAGLVDPETGQSLQEDAAYTFGDFDNSRLSGKLGSAAGNVLAALPGSAGGWIVPVMLGASSAGQERMTVAELRKQGYDISAAEEWGVAILTGATEIAAEKIGIDAAVRAGRKMGGQLPQLLRATQGMPKAQAIRAISRILMAGGEGVASNAAEEYLTQIGQNAARFGLIDSGQRLDEGAPDAALAGALTGGLHAGAVGIATAGAPDPTDAPPRGKAPVLPATESDLRQIALAVEARNQPAQAPTPEPSVFEQLMGGQRQMNEATADDELFQEFLRQESAGAARPLPDNRPTDQTVATEEAPAATSPDSVRPSRNPVKLTEKRPFTRADLQGRIIQHYDELYGDQARADEESMEAAGMTGEAFTFFRQLPGEVKHFIESNPGARRLFRVTENAALAKGEDAMAEFGDDYWRRAGEMADSRLEKALGEARKSPDPSIQFLAAAHDNLLPRGERPKTQRKDLEQMPVGARFKFQDHDFEIIEDDETGIRFLRDGEDFPVIPVDALGDAGKKFPTDKGTYQEPDLAGVPDFMAGMEEEAGGAGIITDGRPTDIVPTGNPPKNEQNAPAVGQNADGIVPAPPMAPSATSTPPDKPVGRNTRGTMLYEDERGVRYYFDGGFKVDEPVQLVPGGGIRVQHRGDFLTAEEAQPGAPSASSTPPAERPQDTISGLKPGLFGQSTVDKDTGAQQELPLGPTALPFQPPTRTGDDAKIAGQFDETQTPSMFGDKPAEQGADSAPQSAPAADKPGPVYSPADATFEQFKQLAKPFGKGPDGRRRWYLSSDTHTEPEDTKGKSDDEALRAIHKRAVRIALASLRSLDRTTEIPGLGDYPDLLAFHQQRLGKNDDKRVMTRDKFQSALRKVFFPGGTGNIAAGVETQRQLNAVMAVTDARANAWAKANRRTPDEWYATHIAGIHAGNIAPGAGALFQDEAAETFYRQLDRVIAEKMAPKAQPQQLLALIRNSGIKPDEIKWSGIEEFLAAKTGPVTKVEVERFLEQNHVRVNEVLRDDQGADQNQRLKMERRVVDARVVESDASYALVQALDKAGWSRQLRYAYFNGEAVAPAELSPADRQRLEVSTHTLWITTHEIADQAAIDAPIEEQAYRLAKSAHARELAAYERIYHKDPKRATRYKQYTLPGGENYRELLLQLATPDRSAGLRFRHEPRPTAAGYSTLYLVDDAGKVAWEGSMDTDTPEVMEAAARDLFNSKPKEAFTSSHWKEENVLAHVRFNDRTGPGGAKTLLVEEIQSDWHQKGRKHGYSPTWAEQQELEKQKQEAWTEYRDAYRAQYGSATTAAIEEVVTGVEWYGDKAGEKYPAAIVSAAKKYLELRQKTAAFFKGAPGAPFAKTWHLLAFKRMVRWAAENGYDAIAWTTGKQNADRYSLRKQISAITYSKLYVPPADGWVDTMGKTPRWIVKAIDNSGREVLSEHMTAERMEEMLGKEMAEKIVGDKRGSGNLTGLDLETGGEGMVGFYDQKLVNDFGSYVKKWGAKVEQSAVSGESAEIIYVVRSKFDRITYEGPDLAAAQKAKDAWGGEIIEREPHGRGHDAWTVKITPAMRDSVMRLGQPLFQGKKAAVEFLADGRAVIHALQQPDVSSVVHELGHIFRRDLSAEDLATAETWAGVRNGDWTIDAEEQFARGFERYLADGETAIEPLRRIFERFKKWLGEIYTALRGSPIAREIPQPMREVFDRLLGYEGPDGAATPEASPPAAETPAPEPEPAPPAAPAPTAPADDAEAPPAGESLAHWLADQLARSRPPAKAAIVQKANELFGGTMGEGKYTARDLADAVELGMNLHVARQAALDPGWKASHDTATAQGIVREIANAVERMPTQTVRDAEQVRLQQFSTPPHYAYAIAWAANIRPDDVVLEPSAGTGSLAAAASTAKPAKLYVNELSDRRAKLLQAIDGVTQIFTEDAEQIAKIQATRDLDPTIVVMNPPFSRAGTRTGDKLDLLAGARHISEALAVLRPGGRLVAIVGRGMSPEAPTYRDWFAKLRATGTLRANIGVDGDVYKKYGTSFATRVLVIDKVPTSPDSDPPLVQDVQTVVELIGALESTRYDRPAIQPEQQRPAAVPGQRPDGGNRPPRPAGGPGGRTPGPRTAGPDAVDDGNPPAAPSQPGSTGRPVGQAGRPGSSQPVVGQPPAVAPPAPAGGSGRPAGNDGPSTNRPGPAGTVGDGGQPVAPPPPAAPEPANPSLIEPPPRITNAPFQPYRPARTPIVGVAHPSPLVQSAAMAAVSGPPIVYTPQIGQANKYLSTEQIEAIALAGQAHSQMLPSGARRGIFIGDGTGAGKGSQLAGIILDNFNRGRTKAVWVTTSDRLVSDARRDWTNVSGRPAEEVMALGDWKVGDTIDAKQGIILAGYHGLGGKFDAARDKNRILQLAEWLGKDFDGVIAFDEAHKAKNAADSQGSRGVQEASKIGRGVLLLQELLPNARVVYASATGATEARNLSYAERLGLWGPGTSFPDRATFVNEIQGRGLSALELVSQDMKRAGQYLARTLSFEGIEYAPLEHKLTDDQVYMYDKMAEAWSIIMDNVMAALGMTAANHHGQISARAKSNATSAFYGSVQRFFNQIITAMQVPSVIADMEQALARGEAPVLQLVNTGEATATRKLKEMEEGDDLDSLDLTPRDLMMNYLRQSFPVQQYEEYTDDQGNTQMRPVVDSEGNAVLNPDAVAARDRLMRELGSLRIPETALDQIINHFGHDKVAEVTARSFRIVTVRDAKGERKEKQAWSKARALADARSFQDDKKRILIFSDAGGTGASYHASASVKNQRLRMHYLLQAGWVAENAIQGFGRTHRSDEVKKPVYRLVTTDLKGQKRFISSIARRLDGLGAATQGQRGAGSGMFNPADNLEGPVAREAIHRLYARIVAGAMPNMSLQRFEKLTNLKLTDSRTGQMLSDPPPITKFLNRVLALPVAQQNEMFAAFEAEHQARIDLHTANGTLDQGMETVRADSIVKGRDLIVRTDPADGTQTRYVELTVRHRSHPRSFDSLYRAVDRLGDPLVEKFVQNVRSGKVWAIIPAGTSTNAQGQVVDRVRRVGPISGDTVKRADIDAAGTHQQLAPEDARPLWDEQMKQVPEFDEQTLHLITGRLLPIWDRLPRDTMIAKRVQTDDGETILGLSIPDDVIDQTLQQLGAGADGSRLGRITPQQMADQLIAGRTKYTLANGWELKPVRAGGERRIELTGPDMRYERELGGLGVIIETRGWQTRFFIPTDDRAAGIIAEIIKTRPLSKATKIKDDGTGGISQGRAPTIDATAGTGGGGGGSATPPTIPDDAPDPDEPGRAYEPQSDAGRKLVEGLRKDTAGTHYGPRDIYEFLNDALKSPMIVGKSQLTRRNPAHYVQSYHAIRTRSGVWTLNFHEHGHAISAILRDRDEGFADRMEAADESDPLMRLVHRRGSMASKNSPEEGFAEWMRLYVTAPQELGDLAEELEVTIASIAPEILDVIRDTRAAWVAHRGRSMEAQLRSMQLGKPDNTPPAKRIKDLHDRLLFTFVNGQAAIDRFLRGSFNTIKAHSIELARHWRDSIRNTPADVDMAFQSTVRVPQEVARAMYGAEHGQEGIRVLATGNAFDGFRPKALGALQDAGFELPSVGAKHGSYVYLHRESIRQIYLDVGKDNWPAFEIYGQYRAALHRWEVAGHAYPGLSDGFTPDRVRDFLNAQEIEHPEWDRHFKRVNTFMDQLLLMGLLSGEFDVPSVIRIKQRWEDYWPLNKQVEDRPTRRGGGGVVPSSGVHRAYGSESPFENALQAFETRVKKSYEAYYQSRLVNAVAAAGREMAKLTDLPVEVRAAGLQTLLPLHMDMQKVATMSEREMQQLIADYLNDRAKKEAPDGFEPTDEVLPNDVVIDIPGKKIFRAVPPKAVRVVVSFSKGQKRYWQVTDPLLFDLFARSDHPGKMVGTVTKLGTETIRPWRRSITQNVLFALRNAFARDPMTASANTPADAPLMEAVPGFYFATGLVNRIKGDPFQVRNETELMSKAIDHTNDVAHQGLVEKFKTILGEGIVVPGWSKMHFLEQAAEAPGQILSTVTKPIDIALWVTGQRWLSQTLESLPREGAAVATKKRGGSDEQALAAAERISGNFGMKPGDPNVAAFWRTAGFFNPALQVMYQQYTMLTDPDPRVRGRHAIKYGVLGAVAAIGAAINFLMSDDEERRRLAQRKDADRYRNVSLGGIRLPFDHGPAGAVMSYGWNSMETYLLDSGPSGTDNAKAALERAISLPGLVDWMHPFIRTAMELKQNHSWFTQDYIVPRWMEDAYPQNPELQALPSTPETYKRLGELTGTSPIKWQYGVRNVLTSQADQAIRLMEGDVEVNEPADTPFIGGLFTRRPEGWGSRDVAEASKAADTYNAKRKILDAELEAAGVPPTPEQQQKIDRLIGEMETLQPAHDAMRRVRALWRQIKVLERSNVADKEQRIEELKRLMTDAAAAVR